MAWVPQEAGLVQLCTLFAELQKGSNQAQILAQLDQYRLYPDFNNYLAFIFAKGDQVPIDVRQAAGLYLKNNLRQQWPSTTPQHQAYIKELLLPLLPHPERALRQTAGSCISAIVQQSSLGTWPQLVSALQSCLSTEDANALGGALDSLFKIVEESPLQLECTVPGASAESATVSHVVVPPLLKLMHVQGSGDIRRQATACLNAVAREMPPGMHDNLEKYIQGLFGLAHDSVPAVRAEVCKGMVQMLALRPDLLQPFLSQVIEYMLQSNEAQDEDVALQSCEFWIGFCEAQLEPDLLRPFLPRLIPMLMKNMVFDEYDEDVQEAEAEEAAPRAPRVEKDSELKPVHHRGHKEHSDAFTPDGGEGDDDDDDDDDVTSRWSLRKCSAAGLDRLAVVFGDDLLPVLMPIVEGRLADQDWRARESAILALGAVAEGCHQGLMPYLAGMVNMLLPKLLDPRPMVRVISCWALARYSYWLLAGAQESAQGGGAATQAGAAPTANGAVPGAAPQPGAAGQIGQVIEGLCRCVLDHNRVVQASACSGVAVLAETAAHEEAADVIAPYLHPTIQVLSTAVGQYGRRNLRCLCDALVQLGEAAGPRMGDAAIVSTLLPALCQRLSSLGPHDRDLITLMEVLTMAATTAKRHIDGFAPTLYQTALTVVAAQESARQAGAAGATPAAQPQKAGGAGAPPEYDRDLHVTALDLIAGLAEGLGASMDPLIGATAPQLGQALLSALRHEAGDVRQSGFALVGDLAQGCVSFLTPLVPDIVAAALTSLAPNNINQESMRACNNAAWSLGEMAVKLPQPQVGTWAPGAAERLAGVLMAHHNGALRIPRSLNDNVAIALGRMAMVAPAPIAPHLGHFCVPWCQALRNIRDGGEKEHSFLGLCAVLKLNPEPVLSHGSGFAALMHAVTSWRNIKSEALKSDLTSVLGAVHASMKSSGRWQQAVASIDQPVASKLASMFPMLT